MAEEINIMVVDDDHARHYLYAEIIRRSGLTDRVTSFSNGEEALRYLRATRNQPDRLPDLIFLDLNMPVVDGWQFLHEYQTVSPKLVKKGHILILSSTEDPRDFERAKVYPDVAEMLAPPLTIELVSGLGEKYLQPVRVR